MSEKTALADRLSGWVKFFLLAAVPLYLVFDLLLGMVWSAYLADKQQARRDLCVQYVDDDGVPDPDREEQRLDGQPVTVLGKLHLFFTCADPVKAKIGGFEIERVQQTRFETAIQDTEMLAVLQTNLSAVETALKAGEDIYTPDVQQSIDYLSRTLKSDVEEFEAVVARTELDVLTPEAVDANWWLVVGAHADAAEATRRAVQMVAQLSEQGVTQALGVRVVLREGLLRTVVLFNTRQAAREALVRLEPVLQFGGYVRAVADWCPVPISGDPLAVDVMEISCGT